MSRRYDLRLKDILVAIKKIERYTTGIDTLEAFKADERLVDSVCMNLFVIGEAANQIPIDIQGMNPQIDWRNIIGLRNVLAHEYFRINLDRIWNAVQTDLPELSQNIEKLLEQLDSSPPRDNLS
jgi:uncharacterized protein with HEPN domain